MSEVVKQDLKTEALKLALEALEHEAEIGNDDAYRTERDAIREALAEQDDLDLQDKDPELVEQHYKQVVDDVRKVFNAKRETLPAQQQEPVAYMNQNGVIHPADYEWEGTGNILTPLYTSPPASKPWVGLTDEERDAILDREFKQWWSRHDAVCRAIEAKLREKNAAPCKPLTDEQKAILKECRNKAMKWVAQARIPECGAFAGIAQDLDWLCNQLVIEAAHGIKE